MILPGNTNHYTCETRMKTTVQLYQGARERYADIGVDTDAALKELGTISLSLHCWQADDVGGFEKPDATLEGGGIQTTGNYPGKARTISELRSDLEFVYGLLPGRHRFSIHASYADMSGKFVDRNALSSEQFKSWVAWAKKLGIGMDFNSTFFSHPKAAEGFTLAHPDKSIRAFWIEHALRCREISAYIGKELQSRTIHNLWIPDGSKDITVNRFHHREWLRESLDTIFARQYDPHFLRDSLESKLFGIGSESFVVGSHEFYLGYAVKNNVLLCIDIGHFHPTESCADKVSALFQFCAELVFHITRGVRWDSDHVALCNDPLVELMQEIVWAGKLDKVCLGLDFFDASINRVGAYVIGARATLKAILSALLSPIRQLRDFEAAGKNFERLAFLEEYKTLPFCGVWDYYCEMNQVPAGLQYVSAIQDYEIRILNKRK
jgi:L-rhamnose isomerase